MPAARAPRPARHEAGPFLAAGRPVVFDGAPICSTCGRAVEPVGRGRWRHLAAGEAFDAGSRWWPSPIPLDELLGLPSYAAFAERHPWAIEPAPGAAVSGEADFDAAVDRLRRYRALRDELARPGPLAPGANPYLDLVGLLSEPFSAVGAREESDEAGDEDEADSAWFAPPGIAQLIDIPARRRELADRFAWAIPSPGALEATARHAPLVEAGAGRGYWAALLRARGVDVVATDPEPGRSPAYHRPGDTWTGVESLTALDAVRRHRERTLFLCWPPHDDDSASHAALRAYQGDSFVYVGEGRDGASGTLRFHRELAANWTAVEIVGVPRWPGLADRLVVYRRNAGQRRPIERDRCFECGRFIATGAIGRCGRCFEARPPALAVLVDRHRVEYPAAELDALQPAVRRALEESPNRIV